MRNLNCFCPQCNGEDPGYDDELMEEIMQENVEAYERDEIASLRAKEREECRQGLYNADYGPLIPLTQKDIPF